MAAGRLWCLPPALTNCPPPPVKSTVRQWLVHGKEFPSDQEVQQGRAGRCLLIGSASPPPPPSGSHNCRTVSHKEESPPGRGAITQQRRFGRGNATRRLRVPRSTEWLKVCKPSWKETSADVVSTCSTGANFGPALDSNLPSRTLLKTYESDKLRFWIITVSTSDELLAAATLRAQLFYSYPNFSPSGSDGLEVIKARLKQDFAVQDLLRLRVKAEFERDTKMQALNMNVKCLLAVCEESNHDEMLLSSRDKRHALLAPPPVDSPAISRKPLVAIGTLDIQDGTGSVATVDVNTVTFQLLNVANAQKKKFSNRQQVLEKGPGHRLLSCASKQDLLHVKHGYIFNLCVTETVRRHGVATALMKEAVWAAQQIQILVLYVHVEAKNNSALVLYQKLGYIVEEEEPLDVEYRFQRPRRILLSYHFQ